jgi:hypothetical protein
MHLLSTLMILAQTNEDEGGGMLDAFFTPLNGILLLGVIALIVFWRVYRSRQM